MPCGTTPETYSPEKGFVFSFAKKTGRTGILWVFLAFITIFSTAISWFLIAGAARDERAQMLFSMHARAEALIWAIEGGARLMRHGHDENISSLLAEMGRQPGIAWIAIVDAAGRIVMDSNPQLAGSLLYTQGEINQLNPSDELQGRFCPDAPDIYETWKIFRPARFREHRRGLLPDEHENNIFVALDATDFHNSLKSYVEYLIILAFLITVAALTGIALIFYIYYYHSSRRNLKNAQALASQVIESYPSALIVTDISGQIAFCNQLARNIFHIENNHKLPRLATLPGLDWNSLLKDVSDGATIIDHETELLMKEKNIPASISASTVYSSENLKSGYLFILKDIAEINLLKKKLLQSQRLSTFGKLASGLAHEIRNPLSSICGYARLLEQKLSEDQMGKATAHLLVEEAGRLNGVLADLLNLAKAPALKTGRHSLCGIIKKVFLIAKPDADAKNIELILNLPDDPAILTSIDNDKLVQALLNIVLNAIQSTQPSGTVEVSLKYGQGKIEKGKNAVGSAMPGNYWRIDIKDNGPGMTKETLQQIFTPYFTTRANGAGLGLYIAHTIVESHDGMLLAKSLPNKGATFSIILPAAHSPRQPDEDCAG